MSIIWLPVFHMLYSTLKSEMHNEAAAMVGLAYSISSSAGIAISVTMVSRTYPDQYPGAGHSHHPHQRAVTVIPKYSDWNLDVRWKV